MNARHLILGVCGTLCFVTTILNPGWWIALGVFFGLAAGILQDIAREHGK